MWTQQLKTAGWSDEQVRDYVMSGSDNPCSMDAYDAEIVAQGNRDQRNVLLFFIALIIIPTAIYLIAS